LMSYFSRTDQQPLGVADFILRQHVLKTGKAEVLHWRVGVRMAQHALGRKDDQWLAPRAHRLSPQQMEILRCRRRLANLHVVARGKLKIPLDASARVLRPLAF